MLCVSSVPAIFPVSSLTVLFIFHLEAPGFSITHYFLAWNAIYFYLNDCTLSLKIQLQCLPFLLGGCPWYLSSTPCKDLPPKVWIECHGLSLTYHLITFNHNCSLFFVSESFLKKPGLGFFFFFSLLCFKYLIKTNTQWHFFFSHCSEIEL